jgi:uncharacterized membrane protein
VTRRERTGLLTLASVFALAYALYGLYRHWHFGSSAYDLGIFDQVVWHLSRFETPSSSVRGFSHFLGDHFFPILVLFAPLYWIAPAPETLIVAQAVLFAASIVPVYAFARDRLPGGAAFGIATAYALFWGLQQAIAFDVHETAFATLFIAAAILALSRRRWTWFWVLMGALVFVKEDMLPLLTCFGLLLVLTGEDRRGLVLMAASLVLAVVVIGFVIPAFSGTRSYGYASTYGEVLRRPWTIPLVLLLPVVKVRTMVLWVLPFLFLPLRSPLIVLAVPFVITRFLSSSPTHWGTVFHYSAPLAPILAMGAADGLSRFATWGAPDLKNGPITPTSASRTWFTSIAGFRNRRQMVAAASVAMVVLCAVLPGNQPLWRLFRARHYAATPFQAVGARALAVIPPDASVVAQAAVVPHLSQRHRVYVLDANAPDTEFVVAARGASTWPATSVEEIDALLRERRVRGWLTAFEEHGWTVLRRKGAEP